MIKIIFILGTDGLSPEFLGTISNVSIIQVDLNSLQT
jgi:hypothetical protein